MLLPDTFPASGLGPEQLETRRLFTEGIAELAGRAAAAGVLDPRQEVQPAEPDGPPPYRHLRAFFDGGRYGEVKLSAWLVNGLAIDPDRSFVTVNEPLSEDDLDSARSAALASILDPDSRQRSFPQVYRSTYLYRAAPADKDDIARGEIGVWPSANYQTGPGQPLDPGRLGRILRLAEDLVPVTSTDKTDSFRAAAVWFRDIHKEHADEIATALKAQRQAYRDRLAPQIKAMQAAKAETHAAVLRRALARAEAAGSQLATS